MHRYDARPTDIGVDRCGVAPRFQFLSEKNGPTRGRKFWKYPTGLVEEGEDVRAAAVREVMEETGIRTEFEALLAFRQTHRGPFGKSNLFFVCLLRPLSTEIKRDESEVDDCKWMNVSEFAAMTHYPAASLYSAINSLAVDCSDNQFTETLLPVGFGPPGAKNYLYSSRPIRNKL